MPQFSLFSSRSFSFRLLLNFGSPGPLYPVVNHWRSAPWVSYPVSPMSHHNLTVSTSLPKLGDDFSKSSHSNDVTSFHKIIHPDTDFSKSSPKSLGFTTKMVFNYGLTMVFPYEHCHFAISGSPFPQTCGRLPEANTQRSNKDRLCPVPWRHPEKAWKFMVGKNLKFEKMIAKM